MIKLLAAVFATIMLLALSGVGVVAWGFYHFGRGLPDYQQLAHYEPPTMTRVHAGDGRMLIEYAREKRVFVPISAIPRRVIQAFLSAEDKNFYRHSGIDFVSIVRAVVTNIVNIGRSRRPVGASTITQQVAKNFLLTNEVSIERKAKEAILALRIERAFSKDRILELYLNEIYLGQGAYGVAAASLNYFDKPLDQLSLEEAAYLAALPKAPNNYHPTRRPKAALARRNWVISRMLADGAVTADQALKARALPLETRRRRATEFVSAEHFTEEVRRQLIKDYGERGLYEGGLSVRTTLDPRLQEIAQRALRDGLEAYDRRHGWRGPLGQLEIDEDWAERLGDVKQPGRLGGWHMAVVLNLTDTAAEIGLASGAHGFISLQELQWARPWRKGQRVGAKPKRPDQVLAYADLIAVEAIEGGEIGAYALRQIPDIEGGLVALDPHTGRVLAMVGGFDFSGSEFNRVTQARRQPGSAFKPFVYAAALEHGFTPASLVQDAPFVLDQGPGQPKWKPANYTKKFYGPSTLRLGIEKSRNLMTVRLAQYIGMDVVADYAERFGITENMPEILSMALGAGETTLMKLTTAYAMLVNGGKNIQPTLIDRIQDRRGRTIFSHDKRACDKCRNIQWRGGEPPVIADEREAVIEPQTAYQIVSMLEGVVQRGTGRRVRSVGKPLAGKTGTTNDALDAWFLGFSPDLAVGVYTGFDKPRSLGPLEQGASVAAPIFRDFMAAALAGQPAIPFRVPPGIRLVRVNASTGLPAAPGDKMVILEAFRPGTEPLSESQILDGSLVAGAAASRAKSEVSSGTGGLY
jgi:penicillin-binding protein 1A